jgi:hypothetical protein
MFIYTSDLLAPVAASARPAAGSARPAASKNRPESVSRQASAVTGQSQLGRSVPSVQAGYSESYNLALYAYKLSRSYFSDHAKA